MDLIEQAVLEYVTHDGGVFLCPQYPTEGARPDFVALNFTTDLHQVEIIEVSTAYNLKNLADKLKNRSWVEKLVANLQHRKIIDCSWKPILKVFITKAYKEKFLEKVGHPPDVIVKTIDHVLECLLDWQKRYEGRVDGLS